MKRLPLPSAPVVAEIETVDERGRGVAWVDGRRLRVPGALARERVLVRYRRRRRRDDEGELVGVLASAPNRATPRCPHFYRCGGCDWQHLDANAQIEAKEARVLATLEAAGVVPDRVDPPIRGPAYGYRRKARLGVRFVPAKGGALAGFREKTGNRLAEIDSCAVLHPVAGQRIGALRALIDTLDARERIPQVEFAAGDGAATLVFRHLGPLADADRERLRAFGAATGLRIALQPGGPDTVGPLRGGLDLAYRIPSADIEIGFRPLDFVQINAEVNEGLVRRVVDELRPAGRVVDLFSGLGNFTLAIARCGGASVAGFDGEPGLVERARANAHRNGIARVEFHAVDLARPHALEPYLAGGVDRVVLDPPRSGAQAALRSVARARPERIVYVSCEPSSLARDLGELVLGWGYRLRALAVADMFAHTSHVESVATLACEPGREVR